jgi:ubiquinol-cytochrome c reductase cytochrome b subunit
MATAFMGYVLPFGQMSFWGATVITNLLSSFPSLIEWVSGGHYVYNPTLKRFFLFHFQFPFLLCGFRILHLFYLHFLSSNNPLRNSINNKIPFFPFIFHKDFFGFILILCLYLLQTHFGISSFSHPDICPDNAVRFNVMPRRIPDFPDSFHSWNFLSSIGSGITFLSFAIF